MIPRTILISKVYGWKKNISVNILTVPFAASVIGYTTSGNLGIGGLEDSYNDTLNGVNGREYGY